MKPIKCVYCGYDQPIPHDRVKIESRVELLKTEDKGFEIVKEAKLISIQFVCVSCARTTRYLLRDVWCKDLNGNNFLDLYALGD